MTARLLVITSIAAALCGTVLPASGGAQGQRPSLSPISAEFNGSLVQSTTYRVSIAPPSRDVEWTWELEPPADDPNCNELVVISLQDARSAAEWMHGDSDGCRHLGTEHAGRITVFAKTGDYECRATITGTSTKTGPDADLCFRKPTANPPPPPPASSAAPSITDIEKRQWADYSGALFAAGGASYALAIGCALVPSPDPVSKGLAVIGALVGLGQYAGGYWAYLKSKDPPDKNYKRLARLVVPTLPKVKAGAGITAGEAAAANALSANLALLAATDAAFIASFERAQGAFIARDGTWDRRQSRAAAGYARAEAKLLDARPALESALRRAIDQARVPALTAADARRATQHVAKNGLSSSFLANARRLGVSGAPLAAFERTIGKIKPRTITGPVTATVSTKAGVKAYRSSAKLLRALAARLDKR